jgi:UDP-N-acetylglucosamine--N-acetylmuramyl-(pentapeptide) pyrophosphoryl-undecaprenol N-acetylglucosamine transferase
MTRVVIAAGGTGGHVFPALAVAAELRARGVEVHFLGTASGLEARAVPAAGFPLETVDMRGLRGGGWRRWAALPGALGRAVWAARSVLRRLRPAAVLAMGGYVAVPAGLAARLGGTRLLLHEQNAVPGLAIRALRGMAAAVFTGFPEAAEVLGARARWAGIPVRAELLALPAPEARYAEREGPLRVLVFGGSQGARFLNQRVPAWLAGVGRAVSVRHQAGERELDAVQAAYNDRGMAAEVTPFIDDMARAYAWADLVVCRAGAATVAELAAVGVPAVLVPYPYAVDDHQRRNAEALVSRGAALCVSQEEWDDAALAARLDGELGERARLAEMGEAARAFARPDAAAVVADACLQEPAHAA